MSKLKNPLLSLDARNTIGKAISFVKRRGQNIAEKKPEIPDARSLAQLSWRHMYQKAVALWHALSAAEKEEWESSARPKHMTGFAWFMSQALKPNPGLYLPLQGGTMSGDIDMAKNRILRLPAPADAQEPLRLSEFTANIAPYLYTEGARVFHNLAQAIANGVTTALAFNSERYDTDSIHDNVVQNSRLTCQTAGKYVIVANVGWESAAGGRRQLAIRINGVSSLALIEAGLGPGGECRMSTSTLWDFVVTDYIEVTVFHTQGAPLNIAFSPAYSPVFGMQRIGS